MRPAGRRLNTVWIFARHGQALDRPPSPAWRRPQKNERGSPHEPGTSRVIRLGVATGSRVDARM